jgi:iron complex transport system permease protein
VTAALGAAFLVLIDLAARAIDPPDEYPLTIFTAALGGPFFLWLLQRSRSGGAV